MSNATAASPHPHAYLFRNLQLLDPRFDERRGGCEVLVESGSASSTVHVHMYLSDVKARTCRSS